MPTNTFVCGRHFASNRIVADQCRFSASMWPCNESARRSHRIASTLTKKRVIPSGIGLPAELKFENGPAD
jgi:hypothetical protein